MEHDTYLTSVVIESNDELAYTSMMEPPNCNIWGSRRLMKFLMRAFSAASSGLVLERRKMATPKSLRYMCGQDFFLLETTRVQYSGNLSKMSFYNGSTSAK